MPQPEQLMFEGWAHVSRAEDTDDWIAYCPHFDVMTFGRTPQHAFEMIREAVAMVLLDDLQTGRDPHRRASKNRDEWEPLRRLRNESKAAVPVHKVDERVGEFKEFAVQMSWPFVLVSRAETQKPAVTEERTEVSEEAVVPSAA